MVEWATNGTRRGRSKGLGVVRMGMVVGKGLANARLVGRSIKVQGRSVVGTDSPFGWIEYRQTISHLPTTWLYLGALTALL